MPEGTRLAYNDLRMGTAALTTGSTRTGDSSSFVDGLDVILPGPRKAAIFMTIDDPYSTGLADFFKQNFDRIVAKTNSRFFRFGNRPIVVNAETPLSWSTKLK